MYKMPLWNVMPLGPESCPKLVATFTCAKKKLGRRQPRGDPEHAMISEVGDVERALMVCDVVWAQQLMQPITTATEAQLRPWRPGLQKEDTAVPGVCNVEVVCVENDGAGYGELVEPPAPPSTTKADLALGVAEFDHEDSMVPCIRHI